MFTILELEILRKVLDYDNILGEIEEKYIIRDKITSMIKIKKEFNTLQKRDEYKIKSQSSNITKQKNK